MRSDNGGEFTSKDFIHFYENHGIKRQFSSPRTPQQNGVVERKNRTVQEVARTMLNEARLLDNFGEMQSTQQSTYLTELN